MLRWTASSFVILVLVLSLLVDCTLAEKQNDKWDGAISDAELDYCKGLLSMEPPNPEEGWLAVSGAPAGMKVWGRVEEGTSTTVFRVHGKMLNVSVDSVASTMEGMDEKNRREWDSSTLTLKIIARERDDDIVHWITDFPWPLSDREYVFRHRSGEVDDLKVAVSRAVNQSESLLQPSPSMVRIREFVQFSAARQDGADVEIGLQYRNNLEGSLPPWLVNWFSSIGLPKYLHQIYERCHTVTWRDKAVE